MIWRFGDLEITPLKLDVGVHSFSVSKEQPSAFAKMLRRTQKGWTPKFGVHTLGNL
jgi:hypothetical protein